MLRRREKKKPCSDSLKAYNHIFASLHKLYEINNLPMNRHEHLQAYLCRHGVCVILLSDNIYERLKRLSHLANAPFNERLT